MTPAAILAGLLILFTCIFTFVFIRMCNSYERQLATLNSRHADTHSWGVRLERDIHSERYTATIRTQELEETRSIANVFERLLKSQLEMTALEYGEALRAAEDDAASRGDRVAVGRLGVLVQMFDEKYPGIAKRLEKRALRA